MKLMQFFEESNGQLSNTRLNASLAVWTALFIALWGTLHGTQVPFEFVVTLLGYGGLVKVAQKFGEEKKNGNGTPAQ